VGTALSCPPALAKGINAKDNLTIMDKADMANYRRVVAPGGTFFFTVVTYRRRLLFDQPESRQILREVVREVQARYPFAIDAWVLLPEHMHCIWTLPEKSSNFSLRWNLIKSRFSKRAKPLFHIKEWMNDSRRKHREITIWQRRFWEHQIKDDREYQIYMDYTHFNPVKHGLVERVVDWPFSTFHRYVKLGVYAEGWGGKTEEATECGFGE
jgi:putative transposase